MPLCFFEDDKASDFYPLTLTRPVDDLRIGILTLIEKWRLVLGQPSWSRTLRPVLEGVFQQPSLNSNNSCLWINSRYLPSAELLKKVNDLDEGTCLKAGEAIAAARVSSEMSSGWLRENKTDFSGFMVAEGPELPCISNLWDLFLLNGREIKADLERLRYPSSKNNTISEQAVLQNTEQIFIEQGAVIEPGVILLADEGPVYIGKDVAVKAGVIIEGPVAVCEKAVVKSGAKIHANTTIGPVCKVGGEISDSIFHSYSNKAHDGYIGSTLIGQWCNLGAGTNNSNLKNNYSSVRFTDWESGDTIESEQQFLGTIMGDHCKTAINTRLNTGTVCGVNCNIFSVDFPPKHIPSFSWVGSNVIQPYKLDKALETMQAMMARRGVELTKAYKKLMRSVFEAEHGA